MTGKISLAVQIASVLSLTLVSVLVVLLVVNWLGVSESFFRLLEILLSPTVIICALVLYLWRRHDADISNIFRWITTLHSLGPHLVLAQPNKMILDPVLYRIKPDNKSEASPSDTAISSGSPNIDDIDEIKKKATQGDARAQSILGVLYDSGNGVEQDHAKAAKWFRLAAKQGDAEAQSILGVLYYSGNGVEQDHAKAAEYFRLAANQGSALAQSTLGVLYDIGKGVEQDHAEAAKWFRLAAKQGETRAQFNLGVLYYSGKGVEQDHAEAAKWFRLAAEQGSAGAQFNLGGLYYNGRGVEQNHAEAVKWFRLAAEQGDAQAQFNLGGLYHNGEGVAQDYSEAYIWLSLASASNAPNARKARDQVARKLDAETMKNAQAEATRREEKIRRKREGENQ